MIGKTDRMRAIAILQDRESSCLDGAMANDSRCDQLCEEAHSLERVIEYLGAGLTRDDWETFYGEG